MLGSSLLVGLFTSTAALFRQDSLNELLALYESTNGRMWEFQKGCSSNNDALVLRSNAVMTPGSVKWSFLRDSKKRIVSNPCTPFPWWGVTCSSDNSSVVQLNLQSYGLVGPLPSGFFGVASGLIVDLKFGDNCLHSTIPSEIGNMRSLTFLSIAATNISGRLHSNMRKLTMIADLELYQTRLNITLDPSTIKAWTSLTCLDLHSTLLHGKLPTEMGLLRSLNYLDLSYSSLTGPIPSELGLISDLQDLILGDSQITSSIPTEMGLLRSLTYLGLSHSSLTGPIPSELGLISDLKVLLLNDNQITSSIPASLGNLSNLASFWLQRNLLTAQIPETLSGLLSVEDFLLFENRLSGTLPSDLCTRMSSLTSFYVFSNSLAGALPSSLFGLSKMISLQAHNNFLSGSLAEFPWENMISLQDILLSKNEFSGRLPELGACQSLTTLSLFSNKLFGPIPSSLSGLSGLRNLYLHYNLLSKSVPAELLTGLASIQVLSLRGNSLTGVFPFRQHANLENLDLAYNQFSGQISPLVGLMSSLTRLDLKENKFCGTFPPDLFRLSSLQLLYLGRNLIVGTIPTVGLSALRDLSDLSLEGNRLSGSLISELGMLSSLRLLSIGGNLFHGSVPETFLALTALQSFNCSNNQLASTLPAWVSRLPSLVLLDFSFNGFFGPIPSSWAGMTQLVQLVLSGNFLTSSSAMSSARLPELRAFDVAQNNLKGPCTLDFVHLTSLQLLDMSSNSLSGTISPSICALMALQVLYLNENALDGAPPGCLSQLSKLQHLSLSHNQLTGDLDFLRGSSELVSVDISNNNFRGIIADSLFPLIPHLQIFAAAGNCFSGPLPVSICESRNLQILVLDGLSAGKSCRQNLFLPGNIFGFDGSITKTHMIGSIPECFFTALPNITMIHIAGNEMTGAPFSSKQLQSWPSALIDLDVSHNKLGADIQASLQQSSGRFTNLDISFNRFGGTLSDFLVSTGVHLGLRVCRFSGSLSPSIMVAHSVQVLEGNLIECSSRLPSGDPFLHRFKCGSETFNRFMIATAVIVGCCALAPLFVRIPHKGWREVGSFALFPPFEPLESSSAVHSYLVTLGQIRQLSFYLAVVLSAVLLSVYAALNFFYSTHTFLYAWTVSASFKSGATPAAIMLVVWLVLLSLGFWYLVTRFGGGNRSSRVPPDVGRTEFVWMRQSLALTSKVRAGIVELLRPTSVFLINGILVFLANVTYVYVVSTGDVAVQIGAGIILTLCKILWSSFGVPRILKLRFPQASRENAATEESSYSKDFNLELILSAFNAVIAPAFALMIADSNCFSQALYAPPPKISSYSMSKCAIAIETLSTRRFSAGSSIVENSIEQVERLNCQKQARAVSFVPAFTYNFQCSATLLQTYSSIFLFMSLLQAFGEPLLVLSLRIMLTYFPRLGSYSLFGIGPLFFIPKVLLTKTEIEATRSRSTKKSNRAFHVINVRRIFRSVLQDFLLISTFGITTPLCGLVLLISLAAKTLRWHHEILFFIQQNGGEKVTQEDLSELEKDCRELTDMPHPLHSSRWLLVVFSSLFLSFFVLDTAGSAGNWRLGVGLSFVMISLPPLSSFILQRISASRLFVEDGRGSAEAPEMELPPFPLSVLESEASSHDDVPPPLPRGTKSLGELWRPETNPLHLSVHSRKMSDDVRP